MSICRTSTLLDIPRMKELWQLCFGDDETYIDHFFAAGYASERGLVLEASGEVVSMLMTFPQKLLAADGRQADACYIYAFCTHPDHQSRGYGRKLLAWTEERAWESGCAAAIMVPGEESLFRFYAGLGYDTVLDHMDVVWHRGQLAVSDAGLTPITAQEYTAEREKWLGNMARVNHEPVGMEFQRRLCRFSGGGLYRTADGIAAVEVWDGVAEIKELLCSDFRAGAAAICAGLDTESAHVYLPAQANLGERCRFAVVKQRSGERSIDPDSYFAFGFD